MMFCPACKAEYDSLDRFCRVDGTRLVERDAGLDALIGQTLGERYRVELALGHGSQGAVYRAQHVRLRHAVAIKVLFDAGGSAAAESIARFRREAETIAALDHPAIIRVIDFGYERGVGYYLVMELARGASLEDYILERAPLDVYDLEAIITQVGGALAIAHDAGVVHRDLKAANIMALARDDVDAPLRLRVLDFGIAKVLGERDHDANASSTVIGTPTCMAPELIAGARIDHRVDLYAFGVLVYQALTGALPFQEEDPTAMLRSHIAHYPDPPSSRAGGSWIPAELDGLVLSLLAKDAEARPASARDVIARFDAMRQQLFEAWARRYLASSPGPSAGVDRETRALRSALPPVLIVEDEPAIARLLAQVVADEGYRYVTLSSGRAALDWCERRSPLVVLLDVMMPGIDGLSALRSLRSRRPELAVIVCSNLDASVIERDVYRLGAQLIRKVGELHLLPGLLEEIEERFDPTSADP